MSVCVHPVCVYLHSCVRLCECERDMPVCTCMCRYMNTGARIRTYVRTACVHAYVSQSDDRKPLCDIFVVHRDRSPDSSRVGRATACMSLCAVRCTCVVRVCMRLMGARDVMSSRAIGRHYAIIPLQRRRTMSAGAPRVRVCACVRARGGRRRDV